MSEIEDGKSIVERISGGLQLVQGVDGHLIFLPGRSLAFHIGRGVGHLDDDTSNLYLKYLK